MNKCINCKEHYPACQSNRTIGIALTKEREQRREFIRQNKTTEINMDMLERQRSFAKKKKKGVL